MSSFFCVDYIPFGLTFNSSASSPENLYKYNGKEEQQETGWVDFGARMYDPTIGRWNHTDNHAENYYSYSPYNSVLNNPINVIDPDGNDIYLLIWFSNDGETGHGGVAIDNYKKDDDGNYITDDDGNKVKDGTVTYYDLWPNESLSDTELQDDVDADYTPGRVVSFEDLQNTDVTDSRDGNVSPEGRAADGIVQIGTSFKQDEYAKTQADWDVKTNRKYNACENNCSTFAQRVMNMALMPNQVDASQNVTIPDYLRIIYDDAKTVAPNNLYNAALKVKGSKRLKGPEKAEAKPYLKYFGK